MLWRSEYPQYRNCGWNLIRLSHADHTAASALMLGAEPDDPYLFGGFNACSKMGIDGPVNLWRPSKSAERQIIRLYLRERRSPRVIAKRFGTSAPVVRAFLKRIGIKLRSLSESHRWPLAESVEKEVLRLYLNGSGVVQIGAKFGVGWRTVRKFLRQSNIKLRTRAERNAMWRSLRKAA